LKPKIVISGVNLTEMGPLSIFRDALDTLVSQFGDLYEVFAIVHDRKLFRTDRVTYLEFPKVKSSWRRRLLFEFRDLRHISKRLQADLWVSIHDVTPNVMATRQVVYCHNPSPFYRLRGRDLRFGWKFPLFNLLYGYLYGFNIRKNQYVIVQQAWMRERFRERYGIRNIIVAHPARDVVSGDGGPHPARRTSPYCFIYPAFPRVFKNPEVILNAARILESSGATDFEIWLTFAKGINNYANAVVSHFADLKCVRWLGTLAREEIQGLYRDADCLIFPSKLETWGLPLTEAKAAGCPIIAANLPYAHETVGTYGKVIFFDPNDPEELARIMAAAIRREEVFHASIAAPIEEPFASNWQELWNLLLAPEGNSSGFLILPDRKAFPSGYVHQEAREKQDSRKVLRRDRRRESTRIRGQREP
jgi:glycosyltransferase involved in cell wall biosynthesis